MTLRHLDISEPGDNRPPPQLSEANLGNIIRELYCRLYRQYNPQSKRYGESPLPQWDGGKDRWGANHRPIWPQIAAHCLRHKVDPVIYLHVQFSETVGRPSPTPNQLLAENALNRYQTYLTRSDELLSGDKARSAGHLQRRLLQLEPARGTPEQKLLTALMDEKIVQSCPLFRYCIGFAQRLEAVTSRYHAAALQQYVFQHDLYDRAWGADFIPSPLRQEAVMLRARMAH